MLFKQVWRKKNGSFRPLGAERPQEQFVFRRGPPKAHKDSRAAEQRLGRSRSVQVVKKKQLYMFWTKISESQNAQL